jgi:hypothetical protein
VPSGGGGGAAAPAAAGGAAAAAAEVKEEKKEEEKVCVFMFSTLPLCLTFNSLYRKSPMRIWASVCSIRIKLCRCNVFISPASYSTIFVGQRLSELWEEWLPWIHKLLELRISTAFGAFIPYHFPFALSLCVSEWHVVSIR